MPDKFITPGHDPLGNLRALLEQHRVNVVRSRKALADPIAVVAPGIVPGRLRRREGRTVAAEATKKAEHLDIVANAQRELLVAWPRERRPFGNRRIRVTIMPIEFDERHFRSPGLSTGTLIGT